MKKVTFVVSLISVMVFGFASCSDKEQKLDFPQAWGELISIRCVGQDTTTMHYLRADGTVDSTTVVRYLMEDEQEEPKEVFFPASWGKLLGFSWRPVWERDKLEKPNVPVELIPYTNWKPVNGWGQPRWENGVMSADWCEDGEVIDTYSVSFIGNRRPLTKWEPVNGWGQPRWENGVMSADWCEDGKAVTTYSIRRNIKPLTHWEPVL